MRTFTCIFALIATAMGAPILDVFADPCSGDGTHKGESIVGKCYGGTASVLTITETAILKIQSFDPTTGDGTLRLDAEGVAGVHCAQASFKKPVNDRSINVDLSACGRIAKALATAEYCSDQDTIRIHTKVPDSAAPGASNLPLIPVTLKPTPCKDAHSDMKATKPRLQ